MTAPLPCRHPYAFIIMPLLLAAGGLLIWATGVPLWPLAEQIILGVAPGLIFGASVGVLVGLFLRYRYPGWSSQTGVAQEYGVAAGMIYVMSAARLLPLDWNNLAGCILAPLMFSAICGTYSYGVIWAFLTIHSPQESGDHSSE